MLSRLFRYIDRVIELAISGMFMAILVVGGLQIFYRFVLNNPLTWSEEFQKFGHIWIVFLAIPVAYNRGSHIFMNVIRDRLPGSLQFAIGLIVDLMWVVLAGSLGFLTERIMKVARFQVSPALEIPMNYVYVGLVIGGSYMLFVALRKCAGHFGWREVPEKDA
ncbi:TRAP transporter small permease [Shumkonia mesophila]|uniref:TRAP transporter small permease n=1 Tax=Shumkonia mesophila TaxID=2838854 RepID=UPI00293521E9|nr:TRAP transporter small permease [Shumkonia mesophila]